MSAIEKCKRMNDADLDELSEMLRLKLGVNVQSGCPWAPWSLVRTILKPIPINKNSKILVVATIEFAFVAHLIYDVDPRNITFLSIDSFSSDWAKKEKLLGGMTIIDTLSATESLQVLKGLDMKQFAAVIGNPPFNSGDHSDTTVTKVAGNTKLYLQFTKIAYDLVEDDGYMGFITPKGIVNTLCTPKLNIGKATPVCFSLMSDKNYWKYDTCYFVLHKTVARHAPLKVNDRALSKIINMEKVGTWNPLIINQSDKELVRADVFGKGTRVIRYLPGKKSAVVRYDYSDSNKIIYGPKVTMTLLDGLSSITPNDEPVLAGTSVSIKTNTLEEAEKFALFRKKHPIFRFLKKSAKVKKIGLFLKYIRTFDLAVINDGTEWPPEWNLTADEITYIMSNC